MSRFAEIMEDAIRKAEEVDCSLPSFVEGLKEMRDLLQERLDCEG